MFSSTPLAILQPRTALAWQFEPNPFFGLASDFSAIFCPVALPTWSASIHHTSRLSRAGCLEQSEAQQLLQEFPTARLMQPWPPIKPSVPGFLRASFLARLAQANPATCLPPVAITAVPDGELHAPYFMEWSLGLEHQFGTTASFQAQYVGTRAVNQPYLTQVNGYQTVCAGCFSPFPYEQPTDPRFGAVTQLSTGANSHYDGLQLTATKRMGTD